MSQQLSLNQKFVNEIVKLLKAKGNECDPGVVGHHLKERFQGNIPSSKGWMRKIVESNEGKAAGLVFFHKSGQPNLIYLNANRTTSKSTTTTSSSKSTTTTSSPKPTTSLISTERNQITMITQCAQAKTICNDLLNHKYVALDLEGILKDVHCEIWLIQIGTKDENAIVFDIVVGGSALVKCLKPLLESNRVVKICHDERGDRAALKRLYNISLSNVFDTQVMHQKISGTNKRMGLNTVLNKYSNMSTNSQKEHFQKLFANPSKTKTTFTKRPILPEVLQYASEDVMFLCQAYKTMKNALLNRFVRTSDGSREEPIVIDIESEMGIDEETCKVHYASNCASSSAASSSDACSDFSSLNGLLTHQPQFDIDATKIPENEMSLLQNALPEPLKNAIHQSPLDWQDIGEICLDVGRPGLIQLVNGKMVSTSIKMDRDHIEESLKSIAAKYGDNGEQNESMFTEDNRCGLPESLHRISRILNRSDQTIGLTYRVGRYIPGCCSQLLDLVARVAEPDCRGLLLLGKPNIGKTTTLRDIINKLATRFRQRVVVVDTSSEVAGDGDVPHPCIGRARRVQVKNRSKQHEVLAEAVQNHSPGVICIDEVSNRKEVAAVKTIARRGVKMIATVHGIDFHSLLANPDLNDLIGGVSASTVGDEEMRLRAAQNNTVKQKVIRERRSASPFSILVELVERQRFRIYHNIDRTVDTVLSMKKCVVEERWVEEGTGKWMSRRFIDNIKEKKQMSDTMGLNLEWYNEYQSVLSKN